MSNWAGVWIGLWEGDWEGASSSEPGILNAALHVAGTGTATFNAELIGLPVQAGGVGRLIYSSLLQPNLPSTVLAALVVTGRGSAQFAAQVGQRVDAGMVVAGASSARLGAAVAVSARMRASAGSESTFAPAVMKLCTLPNSSTLRAPPRISTILRTR